MSKKHAILTGGAAKALRAFSDLLGQAEHVAFASPVKRSGPMGRAHEQAKTAGHQEGYEKGHAEGIVAGHEASYNAASAQRQIDLEAFASALAVLRGDAVHAIDRWYVQAEQHMAELATVIAARVITQELTTEPTIILSMVREAIAEVTHASTARIRVNVRDLPPLREHRDQIAALAPSLKDLEIVVDEEIAGGCVIDTDGGMIEATIESKLREAIEVLRA